MASSRSGSSVRRSMKGRRLPLAGPRRGPRRSREDCMLRPAGSPPPWRAGPHSSRRGSRARARRAAAARAGPSSAMSAERPAGCDRIRLRRVESASPACIDARVASMAGPNCRCAVLSTLRHAGRAGDRVDPAPSPDRHLRLALPLLAGPFYPEREAKDFLSYYVTRFDTAELNNPFYRTPDRGGRRGLARRHAGRFLFAWKASRVHHPFEAAQGRSRTARARVRPRRGSWPKLGPILFQLRPPSGRDRERLAMLDLVAHGATPSSSAIRAGMSRRSSTSCAITTPRSACRTTPRRPRPWEATASFVYIRGHGPSGRYWGSYTDETLPRWARRIARGAARAGPSISISTTTSRAPRPRARRLADA